MLTHRMNEPGTAVASNNEVAGAAQTAAAGPPGRPELSPSLPRLRNPYLILRQLGAVKASE